MSLNDKLLKAAATAGGITPSEHFGVVLYEGDGAAGHSINGGKFGAAFYGNGSSSKIDIGNLNLGSNAERTISVWINTNSLSSAQTIYQHGASANGQRFGFAIDTAGKVYVEYYNRDAITSSAHISVNTWYHLAVTYNGGAIETATNTQIYVNGSAVSMSSTGSQTGNANTANSNYGIGYRRASTSQYFSGKIDQLRIFSKALTSSQVSTLYAETAATVESLDPLNVDTTDTLQVLGDTSCTSLYRFENNEDDKSGNYNGTGTAIQYAAGRYGQGAIFSDSDSKINIPDNFGAEGETVSYSLWFKTTSANGSYMFAKRTGNNTFHIRIDNSFSPAGKICVNNWAGTAQSANNAQSTNGGYNDGGWHHFVFTYDGNQTTKTKCFIDGVYDSGMDWTYDLDTQSVSGGNNIGNYDLGSSNFSGTIDQVRVFNKTLSASEVTTLYNENPLVASYRFEGNSNDDMRTYNGTDTNVSYEFGLNFTPDFVWIKPRSFADNHALSDSTRGVNKSLASNTSSAEQTTLGVTSFDTGGFTLPNWGNVNDSGEDFVAWCLKANGGTTSSNTDGTNTSTVQTNSDAGFSIVKYTGTGSNLTVGHGLSSAPDFVIVKNLTSSSAWAVFHTTLGATKYLALNETTAVATASNVWNDTAPTATTISVGTWGPVNTSGDEHIAYCFKNIDGFSKFGTYTGNGSTDGPIVETGFEPAFLMIKNTSSTESGGAHWLIYDNKRSPSNPRDRRLYANENYEELQNSLYDIDFLSNGFKIQSYSSNYGHNNNGDTYIYMAFAADPDTEAPTVAKSFNVKTWTGNDNNNRAITGLGFSPNFVWIKRRSSSESHALYDTVRGTNKQLSSDTNAAEVTNSATYNGLPSFDSDGFSVGNNGGTNRSPETYVAWSWKADDNEPTINTEGSVDSIVSANANAGFSIVKYTGTGSVATIGHGLSAAPTFIIVKALVATANSNWAVYHTSVGNTKALKLSTDAAEDDQDGYWNDTSPTATVFTVKDYAVVNESGKEYIAYCFHDVTGYSKIGSYTGTGATGNTVTVGFQPDFVMVKATGEVEPWFILDSARDTSNPRDNRLMPNSSAAEDDGSVHTMDFNSDNFTLDGTVGNGTNGNGKTYIYIAFKMN